MSAHRNRDSRYSRSRRSRSRSRSRSPWDSRRSERDRDRGRYGGGDSSYRRRGHDNDGRRDLQERLQTGAYDASPPPSPRALAAAAAPHPPACPAPTHLGRVFNTSKSSLAVEFCRKLAASSNSTEGVQVDVDKVLNKDTGKEVER